MDRILALARAAHARLLGLSPIALIAIATALLLAAVAVGLALKAQADQPDRQVRTKSEEAYVAVMAEILDVPELDAEASLAGGYNACHWISTYGLDPETLAGWDRYWSEPWEREWLQAAVTYLCPTEGGAGPVGAGPDSD